MAGNTGKCTCGSVRFEIEEYPREVGLCHCKMCRRWGGGMPWAGVHTRVRLTEEGDLRWWRSSEWGERGFCASCGASLFWRDLGGSPEWVVSVGALENEEGLGIRRHIFIDDKGGYYDTADDAPRATGAEFTAETLLQIAGKGGGKAFLDDALGQIRKGADAGFYERVKDLVEKGAP